MHGVGDEDEAVRVGIEGDFYGGGVEMYPIGYDTEVRARKTFSASQDAEDTWVPVMKGTHCVEEMRYHGSAG